MLIHPWDAAHDPAEWQTWLASTDRFGILAVINLDPAAAPLLVPTHVTPVDDRLLLHLAQPNPVWPTSRPPPKSAWPSTGRPGLRPRLLAGPTRRT